jgi:hypothetical protein
MASLIHYHNRVDWGSCLRTPRKKRATSECAVVTLYDRVLVGGGPVKHRGAGLMIREEHPADRGYRWPKDTYGTDKNEHNVAEH